MATELKVPPVGESITEVQIGKWFKTEGQQVSKDEPLVEIESDKVTLELPAPGAGTITKLIKKQGEPAKVGDTIGFMELNSSAEKGGEGAARAAAATAPKAEQKVGESKQGGEKGEKIVMPAAQREAAQKGVNTDQVQGTGPGGRVLKEDVQRAAAGGAPASTPAQPKPAAKSPSPAPPAPSPKPGVTGAPGREEEAVPMTPMRKRIAANLVQAQQTAALLTTFNEVDMTAVMDLRNQYKDEFAKRHGVKLGFMSFFVKAAVDALKLIPAVNAEIRGETIIYKNYYDIGVAIGGGKGLVVPILRNAERMSFSEIEKAIEDFAKRAQINKLELSELQGGTFTISNGGVYGSLLSTPIVSPPQSGILGLHAIQKRAVVVNDQIAIRPMMNLALTYDHRIVDGREAVTFLKRIKDVIENPSRMLIEI